MNETLGRGYARIDAIRAARGEPFSTLVEVGAPPSDKYFFVYGTLFLAGAALLLPFNSFIVAVDYYKDQYPNTAIMYDITTVYIASACVAVVLNNFLVHISQYTTRISFATMITIMTMSLVAMCNIGWDKFTPRVSYSLNLVAVGIIAFGCTVQQASYYGFTGCLPPKYTQAVMAGESAAGFWVCIDRIITKYWFHSPRRSTFIFFLFSVIVLIAHSLLHHVMIKQPFVYHYIKLTRECQRKRRIQLHLTPTDDTTLMENDGNEAQFGRLKLQSPTASSTENKQQCECKMNNKFSFANPLYSPTSTNPAPIVEEEPSEPSSAVRTPSYKVEDVVEVTPKRTTTWTAFKRGMCNRWSVTRAIYPYMVCIGLVHFTTMSLYPGIVSEVPSCRLGSWMPVVLMTAFNFFDLVGKLASAWPYEWSRSQLLMASGVRLLLVPLVLLCAAPRHSPHIVGDMYSLMFSIILGFTNGLFGSVPMMTAPSRVGREFREIAGNVMTLSYNGGLLSGSLVSYLLLGMLGPTGESPCRVYPTPVLPIIAPAPPLAPHLIINDTAIH